MKVRTPGCLAAAGRSILAGLAALALFGLLLGLFWQFPWQADTGFRLATTLLAAALALTGGSFLMGLLYSGREARAGLLFGLVLAGIRSCYAAPAAWFFFAFTAAGALLGALAGQLAARVHSRSVKQS